MPPQTQGIMQWLQGREREMLAFLEALVNQDSGTHDRADVNRVGDMLAEAYAGLGFSVERIRQADYGDHVVASHRGTGRTKRLLCIGHMDTVYPAGTAGSRPFTIEVKGDVKGDVGSKTTFAFGNWDGSARSRWPGRAAGHGFLLPAPSAPAEFPWLPPPRRLPFGHPRLSFAGRRYDTGRAQWARLGCSALGGTSTVIVVIFL